MYRTCPEQTFRHAGIHLGRAAGRDLLLEVSNNRYRTRTVQTFGHAGTNLGPSAGRDLVVLLLLLLMLGQLLAPNQSLNEPSTDSK